MKKNFMSLMVMAVVFVMTAPAMAGMPTTTKILKRIPSAMCYTLDMGMGSETDIRYLFIGFKNMKAIKVYGAPTKIYQAAGVTSINNFGSDMPTAGSAFISNPEDQEFTAVLTTDYIGIYSLEIYWDVDDMNGGVYIYDTSSGVETWYDLTQINCKTGDPILLPEVEE